MCFCSCILFYVSDIYGFLFFKQKTAYEIRISDWSSDVCSSYLHFVDHRIDIEPHQLAIVIDMIDDILIFVHRLEPIGLAGALAAPRLARWRGQREIGVGVLRDEIKFDLGRDDRFPALVRIEAEHFLEDRKSTRLNSSH